MTPEDQLRMPMRIAKYCDEARVVVLAQSISLVALLHPETPILSWMVTKLHGLPAGTDVPYLVRSTEGEGPALQYSLTEVMTKVTQLESPEITSELLETGMVAVGIKLGDLIQQGQLGSKADPLMQFVRHFRNACAHGNRWAFKEGEPKYPAAMPLLGLDRSLHGEKAAFHSVTPLHFYILLEEVHAHFMRVALKSASEAVFASHAGSDPATIHERLEAELEARDLRVEHEMLVPSIVLSIADGELHVPNVESGRTWS